MLLFVAVVELLFVLLIHTFFIVENPLYCTELISFSMKKTFVNGKNSVAVLWIQVKI